MNSTPMDTDAAAKRPLWKRRNVRIAAVLLALPVLALGWWLGSPLFLDKVVIEEFPASAAAAVATADDTDSVRADTNTTVSATDPVLIVGGNFAGADSSHQGSGSAAIYELEDGSHILRFEDLDVTNGPDLHVILTTVADPTSRDDVMSTGYVDLGSLKGNQGDQNYDIPADFDLSGEVSVVIYCQPFHVIFATSTLTG